MNFPIRAVCTNSVPTRAHPGDAGLDLESIEHKVLEPQSSVVVSTGLRVEIPEGYYGRVASRSSLSAKDIEVGAGVVDAPYRGTIKVILRNFGKHPFHITPGMRIAQLLVEPCWSGVLVPVTHLDETSRGEGGFGSSGV